ncbi:MAG TPA: bifunctional phosphoribosylaminoimidazolecarboxamide formyltransferase/IMP cyclohydrolase [Proteobacteria bacterium]|nr:bifunctional phosphoribosylaminoimidazolecarboxamide formyltransferase/IMP cyclohydrolase [Pseudomonadota bacterium]
MKKQARIALISLSDKTGLPELGAALVEMGFEILSTGGTARALEGAGIPVTSLSDYTGFPEMLDGRVKSLHPKIYAGLLADRANPDHLAQLERSGIKPIDLLAVNLYPFQEKRGMAGLDESALREFIDIGGVALLRAAAKNHPGVVVLSDPADYLPVMEEMRSGGGELSGDTRRRLAAKAFRLTCGYDRAIADSLEVKPDGLFPDSLALNYSLSQTLRYGENSHQSAAFYTEGKLPVGSSLPAARQLQGKELSYNNILDLESALSLLLELNGPASVIIKHTNPCGAATSDTMLESYIRARATDPLSAFGSIIAFSGKVDEELAGEVTTTFVEAVIAPSYTPDALTRFSRKKNLRILELGDLRPRSPYHSLRSIYGGLLIQDADSISWDRDTIKAVTGSEPSGDEWEALSFAWIVCKHTRSNAIVLGKGSATIGIGAGQMSRIDAARLAITKARQSDLPIAGSVLASDAFFPFRDVVDLAAENGIRAIVQPGGSIRDKESIAAAEEHGIAMVFTGIRHFRH